jgi:small conductance mechanosensitive channel
VEVTVSASYDAPTEQVMKALREAAEHPAVLAEPGVFAGISTYGDSAITYVLRAWCKTEDYWDLYFAMNSKVRETFANNGVEMTYPHINVHLDK